MLAKNKRISRKFITELAKSRTFHNSSYFTLKTASSRETRAAVTVSKKVSKSAVVRNRVRRRVYGYLKELLPSMKPALYLFIAKPGAQGIKGEELKSELIRLIKG